MIISTAVDLLVEAELKQLSVKSDKDAIRGFINSGILELYKRFNLWEVNTILTMVAGTSLYKLDGVDANLDMDLSDHQYLMVEEVWLISDDEKDNQKLSINNEADKAQNTTFSKSELKGIFTYKFDEITVTTVLDTRQLKVIYRAAPLSLTNEKAEIPLPPQFQEALFNYVGYRGHGSVKGDIKSENNTHYMRFEASCNRIKVEGLTIQDDLYSTKFENRGFV